MREKLIEMYLPQVGEIMPTEVCRCDYCMKVASGKADQILTLIRAEIEKSLLTDEEIGEVLDYATPHLKPNDRIIASLADFKGVAQAEVDKILALFKEKGKTEGNTMRSRVRHLFWCWYLYGWMNDTTAAAANALFECLTDEERIKDEQTEAKQDSSH